MSKPELDAPTPMVRHYLRVKGEHPDEILLYRIGDFYETFGDDAVDTSRILNITLTKKHVGNGRTMPLAGIPYHSLDGYLGKLVRAGKRIAICEQIEDAADVKGRPVERAVVRIVTPGTLIEENLLEDKAHNYLAAVGRHGGVWGLSRCDLSTGSLAATQFSGDDSRSALLDEITRFQPSELIGTEDDLAMLREDFDAQQSATMMFTRLDTGSVKFDQAAAALLEQLGVQNLEGFGAGDSPAAVCAAGAIVAYLRQTQRRALGHIHALEIYSTSDFMVLDAVTQRSLELVRNLVDGRTSGTLLETLDHTRTPMGGRLLRQWLLQPLQCLEEILARQEAIQSLHDDNEFRDRLRQSLAEVRDIERILTRVHCRTANARDLLSLARSLRQIPQIKESLVQRGRGRLRTLGEGMALLEELADWIEWAIVPEPPVSIREGGIIRDNYNKELDDLREITRGGKSWISKLKQSEIERTGITSLKIGYNRVFGYYIEVSKSNTDRVPPEWERRQTLTGGERYVTPELKEKESLILGAEEKIATLEGELFEQLRAAVEKQTAAIQQLAAEIAQADALTSLAHAALLGGYIRPEMDGSDLIDIKGGRHPVVEALLQDRPFVSNDLTLDSREEQIWVITGPNMAGKSTFIRQAALLTLMAHTGSFIPARSARIGLVDRIFTRVGATDYLTRGQSTFLVEMTETANILNNATPKSLVILDEIGRGTSTYDGLSIAWAVLEYIHEKKKRRAKTLFATHYHELAALEGKFKRARNYNVAVREEAGEITFLYQIVRGSSDHSYGIHAARLAGIPQDVVARAKEILFELECSRQVGDAPQTPVSAPPAVIATSSAAPRQLDLFAAPESPILEGLRNLDISRLTPMQSMQILDELIRAARQER